MVVTICQLFMTFKGFADRIHRDVVRTLSWPATILRHLIGIIWFSGLHEFQGFMVIFVWFQHLWHLLFRVTWVTVCFVGPIFPEFRMICVIVAAATCKHWRRNGSEAPYKVMALFGKARVVSAPTNLGIHRASSIHSTPPPVGESTAQQLRCLTTLNPPNCSNRSPHGWRYCDCIICGLCVSVFPAPEVGTLGMLLVATGRSVGWKLAFRLDSSAWEIIIWST